MIGKKTKALMAGAIATIMISSGGIVVSKVSNKIENLTEINEILEKENKEKDKIIYENNKSIKDLNTKISDISEELESARRDIAKYTRVTHYNRNDVTQKSNATNVHLRRALKGTALENSAESFVEAELKFGVNAFFLIAICAEESGWGTSPRAVYQNNLTGYAVFNSTAEGKTFDTWHKSIIGTAELLKQDYLTEGGVSFNGLSSRDVNTKYCFYEDKKTVDYNWSVKINSIAYDLVEKANNF